MKLPSVSHPHRLPRTDMGRWEGTRDVSIILVGLTTTVASQAVCFVELVGLNDLTLPVASQDQPCSVDGSPAVVYCLLLSTRNKAPVLVERCTWNL